MISYGFTEKSNQGDCEDFAGIGGESCDETEKEPGKTLDFTAIGSRKCEHEAVMCVGTYTLRGEVRKWPVYVCIAAECGCTCELRGFLSADTCAYIQDASKVGQTSRTRSTHQKGQKCLNKHGIKYHEFRS